LVIGEHLPVARGLRDLHFCGYRQRHGPCGSHAKAELSGGADEHFAAAQKIGPQAVERIDHGTVRFDRTALQLGNIAIGQQAQQLRRARRQPSRF
jgi:hypothetical protein